MRCAHYKMMKKNRQMGWVAKRREKGDIYRDTHKVKHYVYIAVLNTALVVGIFT